jgi:type II secretory pathway component PulF
VALIVSPKQLRDRSELYHQLAVLVASGIPMIQALEMQQRNPANRASAAAMANVLQLLQQGRTVTDAFQAGGDFPEFDSALIEAGDKSGRLDQCFKLLSSYYEHRAQILRSVIGGLIYPAFLIHMVIFIFPFIEYFRTSNLTKFILEIVVILIPLYALVIFIIFACQGRHGEKWRSMIEQIANPIPFLGKARRELAIARLSAALEALLNAGVSIIGGWQLAAAASGSPFLRRTVSAWKTDLENGATPAELVFSSHAFPGPFVNLYQTGEATGTLDDALKRLHAMYDEEGRRHMQMATVMFSKLVYGCVVAIVAFKVISFYMGMYGPGSELDKALGGFGPKK